MYHHEKEIENNSIKKIDPLLSSTRRVPSSFFWSQENEGGFNNSTDCTVSTAEYSSTAEE
jgi:hypothetical protein